MNQKNQLLINRHEGKDLKYLKYLKAFIEYSNGMDNIYRNMEEYTPDKERKILLVFNMIADMLSNRKLHPIIIGLFIRGRKLDISLTFITQYYFAVPINIRINSTDYFIVKILNKQELQQIAFNHLSSIASEDFFNVYKKCYISERIF